MSLDGFIAGPHDELDWLERGGGSPEDHGFGQFFASVDQLLKAFVPSRLARTDVSTRARTALNRSKV
jgi:hypothetical protein